LSLGKRARRGEDSSGHHEQSDLFHFRLQGI
jgi:hypothetical protein